MFYHLVTGDFTEKFVPWFDLDKIPGGGWPKCMTSALPKSTW
jgi:hypothetical protein